MKNYDVIIVGGGPAGAACATVLAQNGIRTLVCEKTHFPREKICGECVNPRVWPLLETFGVANTIRAYEHTVIDRLELHSINGKAISLRLQNRHQQFIAMPRRAFDSILLDHAVRSGATVIEGAKVTSLVYDGRWHVRSNGQTYTATYLVGADGRNSTVARLVAKDQRRGWFARTTNRVGVQWHTEFQRSLGSTLALFLFPGGYVGVVNVDASTANVAMVVNDRIARHAQHNFDLFLERTIRTNRTAAEMFPSLPPISKPTTTFPVDPVLHQSGHSRAFLVGDARQTVEPFTGEGIFFAVHDGVRVGLRLCTEVSGRHPDTGRIAETTKGMWAGQLLSLMLRSTLLRQGFFPAARIGILRRHFTGAILGEVLEGKK